MSTEQPASPATSNSSLAKAYEAKHIEPKWYTFWETRNFFKGNPESQKPAYSIVIPPPNVTGALHMGHALVNTLQDILIRWHRMSGFETLWVPGTDHAGIATQTVVERHLIKTQHKKRSDYSREEFLAHIWKWKEAHEHQIINQLKRLGCSCDWSRQRFTMDEGCNIAVKKVFKLLYDQGLIYRGDYLVNWDPVSQTAIADDEVEYEEKQSFLWHFKYPLQDGSGFVKIATTRPETMLGDTAIAVSPSDKRYSHLVGKMVLLPLMDRAIPIIADRLVDPEFGTGMVKVTPAHDPNDYQMGLTHSLPFINIMTPDGKINENGGRFQGLTMEEARKAVVQAMKDLGYVEKIEPHTNRVGISYRSKAVIEPYMSKQWFVRMGEFGKKLRAAVSSGRVQLIPENWNNTYNHWIDNLRDWCISRQLWWGHRIPIWYSIQDPNTMICYDGDGMPPEVAAAPHEWRQDEDVLDTWFSSALWPFSTLGWPEQTPDLKKFYPNAVLVTGHDILFFWVARMILMGEHVLGEVPFPKTFLHGLIYGKSYWRNNPGGGITYVSEKERHDYEFGKPVPKDVQSKWEKMSKTKGNIIDPLEIIDLYGTDAMRMALCASSPQLREIDLDLRRFEEFKNFANKMWNGARFVFLNLEGDAQQGTTPLTAEEFSQGLDVQSLTLEDQWLLSVLNRTIQSVNEKLGAYAFDQAALEAYGFFWNEFCSYYLEISKPVLFGKAGTITQRKNKQKLLTIALCISIRLIHPMAPFITEELFQLLKDRLEGIQLVDGVDAYTAEALKALQSEACIIAPYPQVISREDMHADIEQTFQMMSQVVYMIRNMRGELKLPPGTTTDIYIVGDKHDANFVKAEINRNIITSLVRTGKIEFLAEEPAIGLKSMGVVDSLQIFIPLPAEFVQQEQSRLTKESEKLSQQIQRLEQQLSNEEFVKNAPGALVEKHKQTLEQNKNELRVIAEKLATFER